MLMQSDTTSSINIVDFIKNNDDNNNNILPDVSPNNLSSIALAYANQIDELPNDNMDPIVVPKTRYGRFRHVDSVLNLTALIPEVLVQPEYISTWQRIIDVSVASVKKTWKPGLICQLFALLFVVLYYASKAVGNALDELAKLQQMSPYLFGVISMQIFVGLTGFFSMLYSTTQHRNWSWKIKHFLFFMIYSAWRGAEITLFYSFQNKFWQQFNISPMIVVVCKVLLDQLIYWPLYCNPAVGVVMLWEASNFQWEVFKAVCFTKQFWFVTLQAQCIVEYAIWIPILLCLYALPVGLQMPLLNISASFWVILQCTFVDQGDNNAINKADNIQSVTLAIPKNKEFETLPSPETTESSNSV